MSSESPNTNRAAPLFPQRLAVYFVGWILAGIAVQLFWTIEGPEATSDGPLEQRITWFVQLPILIPFGYSKVFGVMGFYAAAIAIVAQGIYFLSRVERMSFWRAGLVQILMLFVGVFLLTFVADSALTAYRSKSANKTWDSMPGSASCLAQEPQVSAGFLAATNPL